MPLVFVYGTLKEGFPNAHVNGGVRLPGGFRTRERFPMYLLGDGHVPCVVLAHGTGHHVLGEVYEVSAESLAAMDRLERFGEDIGYLRPSIEVVPTESGNPAPLVVYVYAKSPEQVASESARVGPLPEYLPEHTALFRWKGAA